jgi:hypothetical protein
LNVFGCPPFRHQAAAHPNPNAGGEIMAEKVKKLSLERDYKKYLYFLDGSGNVCRKLKTGEGKTEVLVENAVERDNSHLYFIDKDGDVARSPRVGRGSRKKAA